MKGKLFLLPNFLDSEHPSLESLPSSLSHIVKKLDGIFAESEKGARKFLKNFTFDAPKTFRDVSIKLLNEHCLKEDLNDMVTLLEEGQSWGIISDCGMPCLADPGSLLIQKAKQHLISLEVIHGPSSLTHALIVSGFSAQSFAFHGYLPRKEPELIEKLRFLEQSAQKMRQTQLFIETPYRNQKLLDIMLQVLRPKTKLCIAIDLMTKHEKVLVDQVVLFKKKRTVLPKSPAVFLISS